MNTMAKEALIGLATRYYRRTKTYMLTRHPPVLTPLFFRAVWAMDVMLSPRRDGRHATPLPLRDVPRLKVVTEYPVAVSSDDHQHPRGAQYDNSRNPRFNRALYETLGCREQIAVMDLGCSGGGLVRSFLEDGHIAVGLEGSDVAQRTRSGEWGAIPHQLFTCDITKPFGVTDEHGRPFQFDAVTAWEVLEHIPELALDGLLANIRRHLKPGGYFIGSVDMLPDGNPLTGAVYHHTLQPKTWWLEQFAAHQLIETTTHTFTRRDMVRGSGLSLKDWRPEDGGGFHLVLRAPTRD